jgi:hypothetical protein
VSAEATAACRVEELIAEAITKLAWVSDQVTLLQQQITSLDGRLRVVEARARAGRFSPATGPSAPGDALWEVATAGRTEIVFVPTVGGSRLN